MAEKETLMSLRPQTTHEKLIWERFHNQLLLEELREVKTELGMVRSEFDEFKYMCKQGDDIESKYKTLVLKHKSTLQSQEKTQRNLREARRDNDYLMTQLANANLKLKYYEEKKQMDDGAMLSSS